MNDKSLGSKRETLLEEQKRRRAKEKKSTEHHERGTGQLKSVLKQKGNQLNKK
jgi:hypothetical protein